MWQEKAVALGAVTSCLRTAHSFERRLVDGILYCFNGILPSNTNSNVAQLQFTPQPITELIGREELKGTSSRGVTCHSENAQERFFCILGIVHLPGLCYTLQEEFEKIFIFFILAGVSPDYSTTCFRRALWLQSCYKKCIDVIF